LSRSPSGRAVHRREFGVLLPFCPPQLIGDMKFLTTLPNAKDRAYGERLREASRRLFAVIHRREELPDSVSQDQLEAAPVELMRCDARELPETKPGRDLAKRFEAHGERYFRYVNY
jgi:hypothetical protein